MRSSLYQLGVLLLTLFKCTLQEAASGEALTQVQPPTNELKYKIAEANNKMNVQIILSGNVYTSSNYCQIKKSNDGATLYEDISSCPGAANTNSGNKCVRKCVGNDNILEFNKFSPRTKYIVVFKHNDVEGAVAKNNEGTVFGLELRLIVNPNVVVSTTAKRKLKFCTTTFPQLKCPIYYKGVEYVAGTEQNGCTATENLNEVEFDLMIPHYEVKCENYPSFFYKLQNDYTLSKIDVYKPQYYVAYASAQKNKYSLKFSNKFPFEICRFSIRDGKTEATTNEYISNCGGQDKPCYAPCNNVELTFTESKTILEVLIQTRHFPLEKVNDEYKGYTQKKFVVSETNSENGVLIPVITHENVSLNVRLFKPVSGHGFTSCTVTYFVADKPPSTNAVTPKCKTNDENCGTGCDSLLEIKDLSSGKPYILVITPGPTGTGGVPTNFKEHIFIRTEKATSPMFPVITPTIDETTASIKALNEEREITKDDPTCAYYISPRGKDIYVCAMCIDSYPCRGFCKETKQIVGLTPGTEYDLKVVAHKGYGFKEHQIKTLMSKLTLEKQFTDKGFKVMGSLSTPDPFALCSYKVKVKKGKNFELIHECPATPPQTVATPSKPKNIPKVSKILVARSAADRKPTSNPESNTATTTSCSELPTCSEIIYTNLYDRSKKYQMLVTAVGGRSEEITIDIPENNFSVSEDVSKKVIIGIEREGNKLKVTALLRSDAPESTCGWELRKSSEDGKSLVKSCNGANDSGCETLPLCKGFEILNIEDTNDYHLTVYVSSDPTIISHAIIKQGESHDTMKSTSKNTIIIASAVAGVVVVAIGIGVIIMKRKN